MDYIRKTEFQVSLRRIIKTFGFKDFVQMGVAAATSRKMAKPVAPRNEALRRVKVAETGIIGQDLSSQFEIFGDMVKLVTGADFSMVNILDGKNQFTVGGSGIPIDPFASSNGFNGYASRYVDLPIRLSVPRTIYHCRPF